MPRGSSRSTAARGRGQTPCGTLLGKWPKKFAKKPASRIDSVITRAYIECVGREWFSPKHKERDDDRRSNGQCEYGPWYTSSDEEVPQYILDAVADERAETGDEEGEVSVGGEIWIWHRPGSVGWVGDNEMTLTQLNQDGEIVATSQFATIDEATEFVLNWSTPFNLGCIGTKWELATNGETLCWLGLGWEPQ